MASCDIKNIVSRISPRQTHGIIDNPGIYGDFSHVGSFQEALDNLRATKDEFMRLDPKLRMRFANDPQNLVDFLDDPENHDEAEKLGLIVREAKPTEKSTSVPAGSPEASQSPSPSSSPGEGA